MPVNKHIGKLWFETQEEIDEYDDRMLASMELKSSDFDSEHFAIMSMRERRERVPTLTPEAAKQVENYKRHMEEGKMRLPKNTLDACWELPIFKFSASVLGGYLIMRELPIRNFYARSFAMFFYVNYLRKIFKPDFINGNIQSGMVFQDNEDRL